MKIRTITGTLFLLSSVAACSPSTTQAPGTMPGDMSQEEHLEEAAQHDTEAARHEKHVDMQSKGPQKMEHSKRADQHSDVADQHREAAEQAQPEQ